MRKAFVKILSLILVISTVFALSMPIFATDTEGETQVISGMTYTLKNKGSGLYLTVPGNTDTQKNVYQDSMQTNDRYMHAVRIVGASNGCTISPLVSEEFDGGYLYTEESGNVSVNTEQGTVWEFVYSASRGGFTITNANGDALATLYGISGSLTQQTLTSYGNIFVTEASSSDYQVWILERITVAPQLVKATSMIQKKNIDRNAEWLITLPGSERNNRTITSYTVHSPNDLVEVVHSGNYLAVKIKEYDTTQGDMNDNYAIIDVLIDGWETRSIVVSDSGYDGISGCRSLPFEILSVYKKITINPNTEHKQMLTFRSWVGAVTIEEWGITDDFDCIEFDTHGGKAVVGTSYAVIKAVKPGFAIVTARASDGYEYKMVIEVEYNDYDGVGTEANDYVDNYIIEIEDANIDSYNLEVQKFRNYLIKTDSGFEGWRRSSGTSTAILAWGKDHAVISCDYVGNTVIAATRNNNRVFNINVTPAKGAIIIVPGIMCSELMAAENITYTLDEKTVQIEAGAKLWDPLVITAVSIRERMLALAMNDNGESIYPITPAPSILNSPNVNLNYGATDMYRDLYSALCDEYRQYGYDVLLYQYDWRYDPYVTAQGLSVYIETNGYDDVIFVAHSMGGNVVSQYLALGSAQRNNVSKNITVGTPYLGAEKLLQVYATGTGLVDMIFSIEDIPVLIEEAIVEIAYNIPAVYSLLPYENYFSPYLSYVDSENTATTLLTYSSTMNALESYMPNWNTQLMAQAKINQNRVFDSIGKHITSSVNTYYIVGTRIETTEGLRFTLNSNGTQFDIYVNLGSNNMDVVDVFKGDGDKTVTLHSATIGETTCANRTFYKLNVENFNANHTVMVKGSGIGPNDATTISFICEILELNGEEIDNIDQESYLFDNYGIERRLAE